MRNQGHNATRSEAAQVDDSSEPGGAAEAEASTMVNVTTTTNSTPNTKIVFQSFDKSKEDYLRQFSEKVKH